MIDNQIHSGYQIYPINYVAYDRLNGDHRFSEHYTDEEERNALDYIDRQLSLIDVEDITPEETVFMREKMFGMYANPLANKLKAEEQ